MTVIRIAKSTLILFACLFFLSANSTPLISHTAAADIQTGEKLSAQHEAEMDTSFIIEPPYPTVPPDASKISVGEQGIDGYALVNAVAGAVPPESTVAIINLSAHNVMTATADIQGGFQASLFAPQGSTLLIKYEETGGRISSFWRLAADKVADSTDVNLSPLPGTTIFVGGAKVSGDNTQSFHTVGAVSPDSLPKRWIGWFANGEITIPEQSNMQSPSEWQMAVTPGETVYMSLDMRIISSKMDCYSMTFPDLFIELGLRQVFGAQGNPMPWNVWFDAFLFTPTGLPIEHEGLVTAFSTEKIHHFSNLTCLSEQVLSAQMDTSFTIPADLSEGYYRPEFSFGPEVPESDDIPQAVIWLSPGYFASNLPTLKVGDAAPPRIPWELFTNELINGQRGVVAMQDKGRHTLVTRVTTPGNLPVIPPVDERSGQTISYHLEPGATWLSNTDRRLAPAPFIPLDLPSGFMTIEILKPDGAVDTLGPAPIQGSLVRTPTLPDGSEFAGGTGQIDDIFNLYNYEQAFEYEFIQQGLHTISLHGVINDVFGNPYTLESTYEVMIANVLDVDPNILPTTPFTVGDFFSAGVHLYPPVPAQVTISLTHMPDSDPEQAQVMEISGQANRAGYFQAAHGEEFFLDSQGEFRVDIQAEYHAPDGEVWFGAMTWGGVVAGDQASLVAHGRRGMDYQSDTIDDMPAWFRNQDLPPEKLYLENYYPFFIGDIHWGDQTPDQPWLGDSIHSIITFEDTTSQKIFYDLIRDHYPRAINAFRWPPLDTSITGLDKRIAINEAPLFITTSTGVNPELRPENIDLWGYWYGSSQRPDVRVREIISEDNMGTAYWRFNDTYNYQIGEPADGDQPGDIKWEFGGVVLRNTSEANPVKEYAIYSSFWVLLPIGCDDYGCARVTPPFRGSGALNGGPIMTLKGEEIDILFLPKCIRPGDILNIGEPIAFCGHVGPPLDSRVDVTITSPGGNKHTESWHANKIGWLYDPTFDFTANEPGNWTVDIFVEHDRPYLPTGITPQNYNTGTVLGTAGQFTFFVVEQDAPHLTITEPQPGFLDWAGPDTLSRIEPIVIKGVSPAEMDILYYSVYDKGIVLDQGTIEPDPSGSFTFTYDARVLHETFSMLSNTAHEGLWEGLADEVTISFLSNSPVGPQAARVTLIGEHVFVSNDPIGTIRIYLPLVTKR